MQSSKPISTSFVAHFKLSVLLSLQTEEEVEHMSHVLYARVIGSIMSAMVCTRLDINCKCYESGKRIHGKPKKSPLVDNEMDFALLERH